MTTRPLADFLPKVLPYARACPKVTALQALRMAAIEWCERTRCWRVITEQPITEQAGALVAPGYATIFEIENAEFYSDTIAATKLTPTQFSDIELEDHSEGAGTSPPEYITQASANSVSIFPFATGTLRLSLFLKPRSGDEYGMNGTGGTLQDDQNQVPEHIFIQDAETVAYGALGRLLAMPDVEWADPGRAAFYAQTFNARADQKFNSNVTGQQKARSRSKAHWF